MKITNTQQGAKQAMQVNHAMLKKHDSKTGHMPSSGSKVAIYSKAITLIKQLGNTALHKINNAQKSLRDKLAGKKEAEKEEKVLKELKKIRTEEIKKRRKRYTPDPFLEKAGVYIESYRISKILFNICIAINLIISAYVLYFFSKAYGYPISTILIVMAFIWLILFVLLLFIIWLFFNIIVDFRIFQRKVTIETILPDFLQLTAANVRAGMPIDRALWNAVRPRFGVLSKEIEIVAKQTMSGTDLKIALQDFAAKYKSAVLQRTISLLIEGMESGGDAGDLLNNTASNLRESQLLQKEMAANVTSYAIFISAIAVVIAPVLFALTTQLLSIITEITSDISVPAATGSLMLTFSKAGIKPTDFKIFAILSLTLTSIFSAIIIGVIRKGEVKEGLKNIPAFVIISVIVFLVSSWLLSKVFTGFF